MGDAPSSGRSGGRAQPNPISAEIRTWAFAALLIAVIAAIRGPFRRAAGGMKDPPAPSRKPEDVASANSQAPATPGDGKGNSGNSSGDGEKPPTSEYWTTVRVAALAYFGLLIAVLAGLGIQGDILTRLLRNEPGALAWAVTLTLVGGVVAAIALLWPKAKKKVAAVVLAVVLAISAVVALVGVCVAVWNGTASLSVRETPSLDLSVVHKDASTITVTADAAATSLRANETMLLRVIALLDPTDRHPFAVGNICWSDGARSSDPAPSSDPTGSGEPAGSGEPTRSGDGRGFVLLYWGDTGPTTAGVAATQWKADVEIDGDFGEIRYICAKAVISDRAVPPPPPGEVVRVTASPRPTPTRPTPTPGETPERRRVVQFWEERDQENRGVIAIADLTLLPAPSPQPIDGTPAQ